MIDLVLVQLPNPALASQMYNSLGIMYLASVVEQAGYSVEIADLRHGDMELPEAKFYGFSCTTPEINDAKKLAKQVKGKTIVGGAHPSLLPEDCVGGFDYVVVGEGEYPILEIVECTPEARDGLIYGSRIKNIDKIPYPARHKVKNPYNDQIFEGERYGKGALTATLIATRGCPYNCAFCGNIYRSITSRSVENIIGEMKGIMADGVTHFKFMDDCFTLHPQFEKLCVAIEKLHISYIAHTRSDLMTREKAWLMAYSGCVQSGLGIESADDYVLKLNNKGESTEDHLRAIRMLKEAGIHTKPYWMTGLPGETDKTIELNKQFMVDTQPDKWTISTFTPYPGCNIYNNPKDYGIEITEPDWSKWWNYVDKYNHVIIGQTQEEMYARYEDFFQWLKGEKWKRKPH